MVLLAKIYLKRLQEININHCVNISYIYSIVMLLEVMCNKDTVTLHITWSCIGLSKCQ